VKKNPSNWLVIIPFLFYLLPGQKDKIRIIEHRLLPDKISNLGIQPTKFNWSIADNFLLLDVQKGVLFELGPDGNLTFSSGLDTEYSVFGDLVWMGLSPEGVRLIDRLENEIIFLNYRLNQIQKVAIFPKLYPDMGTIDIWGRMYLYSKTYNGIYSFDQMNVNKIPFIDISKEDFSNAYVQDFATNYFGELAILCSNNTLLVFRRNGQLKMSLNFDFEDAEFLVSLKDNWLILNSRGNIYSVMDSTRFFVPKTSVPVLDAQSKNKAVAVLSKDHLLVFDVK
tara:strand:+ start:2150 stop:2992 length:843 start_codon:yes stop_codon:yes gene_type:complete